MEKWSKYFLSLVTCTLFSCHSQKNQEPINHHKVADSIFNLDKNLLQGSKESQLTLKKAISIDSTHSYALREISVPFLKRGMPHEWKPLYDKAVKQDPQTWVPMRGYLYLLFYRDYKKAIEDFNASDTLTPELDYPQGHSVDYWRGIAYLGLKDYKSSISYFDKHIKKETDDTGEDWVELEAFLYRGIAHCELGNNDEALKNFDKIVHHFKYSAETKFYIARVFKTMNKLDLALLYIDMAIEDFQKGFQLQHDYVEIPYETYLDELEEFKSSLLH